MDKEIADKHYRVVGRLQALQEMGDRTEAMPCDAATWAMILAARVLIQKAAQSAWDYAEKATAVGKPGEQR